ncbi:nitrogen regulatory protein P-II [Corynebacterium renale]|uniref:Nitrogen regulatory protein P-II family n=1 Tax=Corynebacterium renale TaxID=1724 RepID=A0A2A9DP03_9CORY|nr:P-II family nitrogen regulator [Corynebacterium renale]PFG28477.1 nitrogen regulatory protein P-II family [Corynebacterium renale]SQG64927.1 nitrogen regulatory protein P-II [Corynebacterium renale]SQI26343.1 nitrogen regulatory protein P-II [Corynebacterium renale]STC96749.1 nitrogen regulatory protein P-II [Corynebacterium renale]
MKLITAVVKPFTLSEIRDGLEELGHHGMTVSDVRGYGQQRGHTGPSTGAEYAVEFVPKAKVEIVVADKDVEAATDVICKAAWTGKPGDGKLWITTIDHVIRVRTGEEDDAAI